MSVAASRLTAYALLSAIEQDLRALISLHLGPDLRQDEILGEDVLDRAMDRATRDRGYGLEPAISDLETLLLYTDFGDLLQIVGRHRTRLPGELGAYVRRVYTELERLIPVRNRVAHSRPLALDDLPIVLETSEKLVANGQLTWIDLTDTWGRIKVDPSFVLGLQIETYGGDPAQRHNLPTPDFDETGFVGRENQLRELKRLLVGAYPVVSILGEGGIGKTSLLLRAAYDLLDANDQTFDAIVWTTGKTALLTPQQVVRIEGAIEGSLGMLRDVAQYLAGDVASDPTDEVLDYLESFRVLLLLDNLETVLDERLRDFLARLPGGSKVVMTSRIGLGAYEFPMRLEPLEVGEAVQLLRSVAQLRGVKSLVEAPTNRLRTFTERMGNNPGFIKWFVATVGTGKRPEEVLHNSDVFLDFCLSNVFDYLSPIARRVLATIVAAGRRMSQAEIAYVGDFDAQDLQPALQEALTTNMINLRSVPRGVVFESYYELTEFAREYLQSHHRPDHSLVRRVRERARQLGQEEGKFQRSGRDPYAFSTLTVDSRSQVAVSRYLIEAAESIQTKKFADAEKLLDTALALAPGYFEVHRIFGVLRGEQGDFLEARAQYEAALDLKPESAPLRRWFGVYFLRYEADSAAALEQFKLALELDPSSTAVALDIARTHVINGELAAARTSLDILRSRVEKDDRYWPLFVETDLRSWQQSLRQAVVSGDLETARSLSESLADLYPSLDAVAGSPRLVEPLRTVAESVAAVVVASADAPPLFEIDEMSAWVARIRGERQSSFGAQTKGRVDRVFGDRGYGFIRSEDGRNFFFHRSHLRDARDWESNVQVGATVEFTAARSGKGYVAKEITIVGATDNRRVEQ